MGFYKAYELKRRIRDIIMLQNMFRLLETEIYYTRSPVPAALEEIALKVPEVLQCFCREICTGMEQEHLPLAKAWEQGVTGLKDSSFLCAMELDAVYSFGRSLGTGDVQEQLKYFQMLQQRLQFALEQAEQNCAQKERIWQYMGVCISVAAVLLLC